MRQAVIYINVPKEMHGSYWSVFERQNTSCLETAICNGLVVQKTFFDHKYKLKRHNRPNFDWMLDYLITKKDTPYTIILDSLSLVADTEEKITEKLKYIRRQNKNLTIIEVDAFDNHEELLSKLGLAFTQPNLLDAFDLD